MISQHKIRFRSNKAAVLFIVGLSIACAQNNNISGSCSIIATNNAGPLTLSACGNASLSEADRKLIKSLLPELNRMLEKRDQKNRDEIKADLREHEAHEAELIATLQKTVASLRLQENPDTPTFSEDVETARLVIGSNTSEFPLDYLRTQKTRLNFLGVEGLLYVEGNRLFVDVNIWKNMIEPPIQLRHNKLINRPPDWDFNSNKQAFEIVDSRHLPVFQLIYLNDSYVKLTGLFRDSRGNVVSISDRGAFLNPGFGMPSSTLIPIFKYPSWKYQGEMVSK
jgi:hypothetical protein